MKVKGQGSLEYLLIYAFALIVILSVFGIVMNFGITSPEDSLPEQCLIESPFECGEFGANLNYLTVFLINRVGMKINVTDVRVTQFDNDGSECVLNYSKPVLPITISAGDSFDLNFSCLSDTIPEGDMVRVDYDLRYKIVSGDYFPKEVEGKIVARSSENS